MAEKDQLKLIKKGSAVWNKWRETYPEAKIDLANANLRNNDLRDVNLMDANLSNADLRGAFFSNSELNRAIFSGVKFSGAHFGSATFYGADFSGADLRGAEYGGARFGGANLCGANLYRTYFSESNFDRANLRDADLREAMLNRTVFIESDLCGANLSGAKLRGADLGFANFSGACLRGAYLSGTDLSNTNFSGADLDGADLTCANLIETNLEKTILSNCKIYGISAWKLKGIPKTQVNLVITPKDEAKITVDDLQVAQFIYLLLDNKNVRNVVDTITSKAVLILGNFTSERKAILNTLYVELRKRNYLPILFDFTKPSSRNLSETISTLAHLARFVIADITDARSIPQELSVIVPNLPNLPVQPIILESQKEYAMFEHFRHYPWVLSLYMYTDVIKLVSSLSEDILNPLETKLKELTVTNG